MMMIYRLLILLVSSSFPLIAHEVHLHYLPETPVEASCHLCADIEHHSNGKIVKSQHQQAFKVILNVLSDQPDIPIINFPITLSIDFKAFNWKIQTDGNTTTYDALQPGTNKTAAQIARLINRPFKVTIEKSGFSLYHSTELKLLMDELPILREWKFENVLENFFTPFFGLAGQSLIKNKDYTVSTQDTIYNILSIDTDHIKASLIPLNALVKGDILWNRHNALILKTHSKTILNNEHKLLGNVEISINSSRMQ